MHEEIPGARADGEVRLDDLDIYDDDVDVVTVRRAVGMVFQKPNPFPTMSIFDNVAAGLRLSGTARRQRASASSSRCAAPGCGTRSRTASTSPGIGLSGGQQQRLCIARTIAVEPEVILMDEPCSALDPIATLKIEELIHDLKRRYTIVIVTHNMQQAARVADTTAFMLAGEMIEHAPTEKVFSNAARQAHRGVRHGEVRVMGGEGRQHFERGAEPLEHQALGGIDLVVEQLDRVLEALEHQDVELAAMVIVDDDRLDGRYSRSTRAS